MGKWGLVPIRKFKLDWRYREKKKLKKRKEKGIQVLGLHMVPNADKNPLKSILNLGDATLLLTKNSEIQKNNFKNITTL